MCRQQPVVTCIDSLVRTMLVMSTLLISLVSTESHSANGETRCYCNEAACVSSGYMCKSSRLGACFSQLSRDGATTRSTHGCVESLPELDYSACASQRHVTSSGNSSDVMLLCCRVDMCNYMDSNAALFSHHDNELSPAAAASNRRTIEVRANSTERRQVPPPDDDSANNSDDVIVIDWSSSSRWLRVAIIAVPVAGLCLLVPLVVIAARLLTSDPARRRTNHQRLRHWLFTSHVTGNSAAPTDDGRRSSAAPCECDVIIDNRKCCKHCADSEFKQQQQLQSDTILAQSPLHHHFMMAAIHHGASGRHGGYQQIRNHVVRTTHRCCYRHSLDGGTACCYTADCNLNTDHRTIALTV